MPKRYTGSRDETAPANSTAIVPIRHLNDTFTPQYQSVTVQPTWSQSFALSKGTKAELIITGDVTREGLTLLKTYIELTIRALAEETTADNPDSLI
jgi:hypothetical protein